MTDRGLPSAPKKKSPSEKAAQRLLRRERATQELVDTETTYCTLLNLLIKHYVKPLSDHKLISADQHNALFPQIEIIYGLSEKFLEDLKKRRDEKSWIAKESKLSDLFETFTPYFRMYQGYVNNHEKSVQLMRKLSEKEKWVEYCQTVRPLCQRFDLASLLITPIQRIPRYKLLLSEIVKNTSEDHPDFTDLKKSLIKVEETSLQINNRMKEFERREGVKKIERKFNQNVKILEPHRQFIREGKLFKVCRNKDKLYQFFLFNDILIYASVSGRTYNFHNQLPINSHFSCKLLDDAGSYGQEKNGRIVSIVSEKKSFVAYADSVKLAQEWVDQLAECKAEQSKKAHSGHYKTDSHSAAVWTPDSHAKNCFICNDKFSFVNRRHHCRRCGVLCCNKCSKYKLPNTDSVMQRACKKCYFAIQKDNNNNGNPNPNPNNNNTKEFSVSQSTSNTISGLGLGNNDDDSDIDDDFDNENAALHGIPYYIDTDMALNETESIFNKYGHGVGTYVLVPADITTTKNNKDGYCTVTLVVYTQTGFEQFNISLFEKKGNMIFRLESKKLKKKDFTDMNGLISYIEKKAKLIFSYAIPRAEVEKSSNKHESAWNNDNIALNNNVHSVLNAQDDLNDMDKVNSFSSIGGLENYPKAKAIYDYSAQVHGDLTLRAGDIVYILDKEEEDGWWTGMVNNRQGLFPSTYVQIIEEKPLPSIHKNEPKEQDILIARYDYNEGGTEELSFSIGDKIILQAKDESGWWLGKLEKSGVVGWFAPDLVVPLEEHLHNKYNNKTTPSVSTTNNISPNNAKKQNKKIKKNKVKSNEQNNNKPSTAVPKKHSKKKNNKTTSNNKTNNNNNNKGGGGGDYSHVGTEPSLIISYADLKIKKFPSTVDRHKLENYLSNKDFFELFKCTRDKFDSHKGWKKADLRKKAKLF